MNWKGFLSELWGHKSVPVWRYLRLEADYKKCKRRFAQTKDRNNFLYTHNKMLKLDNAVLREKVKKLEQALDAQNVATS